MSWLAVDKDECEFIYYSKPIREDEYFITDEKYVDLPEGSIEKLIGIKITWNDEPVEI